MGGGPKVYYTGDVSVIHPSSSGHQSNKYLMLHDNGFRSVHHDRNSKPESDDPSSRALWAASGVGEGVSREAY